jgi:hypothetical protein
MVRGATSRRNVRIAVGLLLGVLGSTGRALPQAVVPPNANLLFPVPKPYGATYGEWSARWWQWAAAIPARDHPLLDSTGQRCGVGQSGPVWYLGDILPALGTASYRCTIPSDVALFFPVIHSVCAVSPGRSATEAELTACAQSAIDSATTVECEVDGKPIADLTKYRTRSPFFSLSLPDGNLLGLTPGLYSPAVADGIYLMLAPLAVGPHTIHVRAVMPTLTMDIMYHLTVVEAMRVTARATAVSAFDPEQAAAVQITWMRPSQIPADTIVQYQVYRLDPSVGVPTLIGTAYEGNREVFDVVRPKTLQGYYVPTGDGVGRWDDTPLNVPGVVPGRRYRYYVQTVYRESASDTDGSAGTVRGADSISLRISQPSNHSGVVTPLSPPIATFPSDNARSVDLLRLNFTWKSVEGADIYVLQVNAEPLRVDSYREVARILNPSRAGGLTMKQQINLVQQGFPAQSPLAWRVGAAYSQDTAPPLEGFVFSNIAGFSPLPDEDKE